MVTFVGKSFTSIDDLMSGGPAAALGHIATRMGNEGPDAARSVLEELRGLARDSADLSDHAFELGRLAGEINCVWRRWEAKLDEAN